MSSTGSYGGISTKLAGSIGGNVSPDGSGVINIVGGSSLISVTGNQLTHTITIAAVGMATNFDGDTGTALPDLTGRINMASFDGNLVTSAAGDTVTFQLNKSLTGMVAIDFANAGRLGTGTTAGDTLLLRAYDVNGTSYTTFATLTANDTPTMDLDDAVTKAGNYIYRASGTDVDVTDGGTGASSLTDHGVLVGSGTSAITPLSVGSDGQVLVGATGADPAFATLTSSGGTVQFTTGANTLNLEASNVIATVNVTGTTQSMALNTFYIANNNSLVTFTLPSSAAVGSRVAVAGNGSGGWKIAQNSGQTIHFGAVNTTTGTGGYLQFANRYDSIELVCTATDTDWVARVAIGNINYV